jgi:dihydroneopterin aldolase
MHLAVIPLSLVNGDYTPGLRWSKSVSAAARQSGWPLIPACVIVRSGETTVDEERPLTLTRILAERLTPPESTERKVSLCRVFVRDLVLLCSIGIHAREREAPQRVRVNVDIWAMESPLPIDDNIVNVISYEDVVAGIEALLAEGHTNLIETAAEKIAALCLMDRRAVKVQVRVEKLDVFSNAASAGVEIERSRVEKSPPGTRTPPPIPFLRE